MISKDLKEYRELLSLPIEERRKKLRKIVIRHKNEVVKPPKPPVPIKLPKEYLSYIKRANRQRVCFEIPLEDFYSLTSQRCVYCGSTSRLVICRIDMHDGYHQDNVLTACSKCVRIKLMLSHDDFISHLSKILKHLSERK
jgi:hypothetical protein